MAASSALSPCSRPPDLWCNPRTHCTPAPHPLSLTLGFSDLKRPSLTLNPFSSWPGASSSSYKSDARVLTTFPRMARLLCGIEDESLELLWSGGKAQKDEATQEIIGGPNRQLWAPRGNSFPWWSRSSTIHLQHIRSCPDDTSGMPGQNSNLCGLWKPGV